MGVNLRFSNTKDAVDAIEFEKNKDAFGSYYEHVKQGIYRNLKSARVSNSNRGHVMNLDYPDRWVFVFNVPEITNGNSYAAPLYQAEIVITRDDTNGSTVFRAVVKREIDLELSVQTDSWAEFDGFIYGCFFNLISEVCTFFCDKYNIPTD